MALFSKLFLEKDLADVDGGTAGEEEVFGERGAGQGDDAVAVTGELIDGVADFNLPSVARAIIEHDHSAVLEGQTAGHSLAINIKLNATINVGFDIVSVGLGGLTG